MPDTKNDDLSLKMRELDIREKELKNERLLGIIKIITTGVVVTLIPAILTHLIQKQELELQTLKGEIEYLKQFSDKVVERDDLTKRRNFVQYLATVAHSEESRSRWDKYFAIVDKAAKEQEAIERELSEKSAAAEAEEQRVSELQNKLMAAIENKSNDLDKIEAQLQMAKDKLRSIDSAILAKSAEREALIQSAKLSNEPSTRRNEISELVTDMNSPERSERLLAVNKLIEKYRSNPLAVDLSLNSLSPPLLDDLSPSGRINVMVFLRNTSKAAWTNDDIERGNEIIALMRQRHEQGIAYIGPQTLEVIASFEEFIASI